VYLGPRRGVARGFSVPWGMCAGVVGGGWAQGVVFGVFCGMLLQYHWLMAVSY
jgi:hypothetical protein